MIMTQDLYNYFTQRIHKRHNDSRDQLHNKVQVLSIVVLYLNELIELFDDLSTAYSYKISR